MSKVAYIQALSTCFEHDNHTVHATITQEEFGGIMRMQLVCTQMKLDSCVKAAGTLTVSENAGDEASSVELLPDGEHEPPAMSDALWDEFRKMHVDERHVWWTYRIKGIAGAEWCSSFVPIADIALVF